jgi:nitrous oxidase accessory protein NosD
LTDYMTVTASEITWSSWGVFALRCGSISVTNSEVSHNNVGSGNHIGVMIQETDHAYVALNSLIDNWDGVFTYYASNVHIVNNMIAQAGVGIQALYTSDLVVSGNSIASRHIGMVLVDCPDSIIESNTVTAEPSLSDAYFGIEFMSCRNLHVSSNIVDSFAYGIGTRDHWTAYPISEEVVISGNKIFNCSNSAMRIQLVSNMTVTANAFLLNGVGVHVSPTAYAVRIYHNDFLYNSVQAIEDPYCAGIEWDDGYPSGGNFWSDYTGVDLYSGANQDVLGSDGIGDSPYATGVVDRYPYMEPIFDW